MPAQRPWANFETSLCAILHYPVWKLGRKLEYSSAIQRISYVLYALLRTLLISANLLHWRYKIDRNSWESSKDRRHNDKKVHFRNCELNCFQSRNPNGDITFSDSGSRVIKISRAHGWQANREKEDVQAFGSYPTSLQFPPRFTLLTPVNISFRLIWPHAQNIQSDRSPGAGF